MSVPVEVIGIGAEGVAGLSPRALSVLRAATFLAGGRRHLALVGRIGAETFTITDNLPELIERLRRRGPQERCVVLGSGDPLFFGIGRRLSEAVGRDQIVVEPALSSMQLAFARVGLPWDDAQIASIHGRPMVPTLLPLLGKPSIGLFTQDGGNPAAVAAFFLERGLNDYQAFVAENLGGPDECLTALPLAELPGRSFSDLNILILRRDPEDLGAISLAGGSRIGGIPDAVFEQPQNGPVLLTHADVRALVLARFRDLPPGGLWDIGAGLGGVAVELARAFPGREVLAVERAAEPRAFLERNRAKFGAYNMRILPGQAPDAIMAEDRPAGVFLGGSGGLLAAILDLVLFRLRPSGCLVANFVTLENLALCLDRLRVQNWPAEVTHIQVSHGQPLAGLTSLVPQRPIWIVRAREGSNGGG
jgi:precorrin-6B C5,15-methyltransferase / cobalt-precorrin-6B C5,C15-methyltransferase